MFAPTPDMVARLGQNWAENNSRFLELTVNFPLKTTWEPDP